MKVAGTLLVVLAWLLLSSVVSAQIGDVKATGDVRVKRLLDQADLKYEVDRDGDFRLINRIDDDRTQLLFVNSNTERFLNMEIREVWSVGYCPATGTIPDHVAIKLLRANAKLKLGAWQIVTMKGKEHAVFCAQIAADTDVQTLLGTLQLVSEAADKMEAELTNKDDQ